MTDDAFHLTALDARRYDFGNALRGYDRSRVDLFREQVAEELERLSRANQDLEIKARNFHEQLRAFRERDKALNDALISAQQLRGEIREQAQREAQLIIREAQGDSERQLEALRSEIRRAEDELQQLYRNRRSYVQQLRQLAERQLHDLDSVEMVPVPSGIALPASETRESSRGESRAEMRAELREAPRDAARDMSAPVVREFQTPRDASLPPVREPAAPAVREKVGDVSALPDPLIPAPFVEVPRVVKQPWAAPPVAGHPAAPHPAAAHPATSSTSPESAPVSPPPSIPIPPASLQHTQTFAAPARATPARDVPPVSPQAVPPLQRPSIPTPSWLDVVEGEGE